MVSSSSVRWWLTTLASSSTASSNAWVSVPLSSRTASSASWPSACSSSPCSASCSRDRALAPQLRVDVLLLGHRRARRAGSRTRVVRRRGPGGAVAQVAQQGLEPAVVVEDQLDDVARDGPAEVDGGVMAGSLPRAAAAAPHPRARRGRRPGGCVDAGSGRPGAGRPPRARYCALIAQRNAVGVYAELRPGVRQSRISPIATTRTRLAEKPPWLMIPLALANRSAGFEVRAEVEADHRRRAADRRRRR